MTHTHHKKLPPINKKQYKVPGHNIPHPCRLCEREVVVFRTGKGNMLIRVEYRTIRFDKKLDEFFGVEHLCPAIR